MGMSEADTRAKLIDPAIHARGWTEDLIRREESAGAIEIIGGKARKRARGRVDYTLRVRVNQETQPVAVALIEAKAESLPPGHGLEQGKGYAESRRLNVPFVFASNGHRFIEYDRYTGQTSAPRPLTDFPRPEELRARYEARLGFHLTDEAARPLLAPYAGGEGARRYYQDAAIRAVFERLAQGETPRAALAGDRRGQDVHRRESAAAHRRRRACCIGRSSSATAMSYACRPPPRSRPASAPRPRPWRRAMRRPMPAC